MRKDGKSQYQLKKEKLQHIKKIIQNWNKLKPNKILDYAMIQETPNSARTLTNEEKHYQEALNQIWKIVKDEK